MEDIQYIQDIQMNGNEFINAGVSNVLFEEQHNIFGAAEPCDLQAIGQIEPTNDSSNTVTDIFNNMNTTFMYGQVETYQPLLLPSMPHNVQDINFWSIERNIDPQDGKNVIEQQANIYFNCNPIKENGEKSYNGNAQIMAREVSSVPTNWVQNVDPQLVCSSFVPISQSQSPDLSNGVFSSMETFSTSTNNKTLVSEEPFGGLESNVQEKIKHNFPIEKTIHSTNQKSNNSPTQNDWMNKIESQNFVTMSNLKTLSDNKNSLINGVHLSSPQNSQDNGCSALQTNGKEESSENPIFISNLTRLYGQQVQAPDLIIMHPLHTRKSTNMHQPCEKNFNYIHIIEDRNSPTIKIKNRRKQKLDIIPGSENLVFELSTNEVNKCDDIKKNIGDPYSETELPELDEIFKRKKKFTSLSSNGGKKSCPIQIGSSIQKKKYANNSGKERFSSFDEKVSLSTSFRKRSNPVNITDMVYSSDSDIEECSVNVQNMDKSFLPNSKSLTCQKCRKIFKTTRSLTIHTRRCTVIPTNEYNDDKPTPVIIDKTKNNLNRSAHLKHLSKITIIEADTNIEEKEKIKGKKGIKDNIKSKCRPVTRSQTRGRSNIIR